jgi:hypothetical protein
MTCGARLPLGSSPIPMSGPGQNRKSSRRAYVFRLTSESGHCATESACPFRARFGTQVERRTKSNEAPNPHIDSTGGSDSSRTSGHVRKVPKAEVVV